MNKKEFMEENIIDIKNDIIFNVNDNDNSNVVSIVSIDLSYFNNHSELIKQLEQLKGYFFIISSSKVIRFFTDIISNNMLLISYKYDSIISKSNRHIVDILLKDDKIRFTYNLKCELYDKINCYLK